LDSHGQPTFYEAEDEEEGLKMFVLFVVIVVAIVVAVAIVGELRRPGVPLRWCYENKTERYFQIVLLLVFGLLLYMAA
jgi:hypothetical protein